MILFAADKHYGVHPGKHIYEQLKNDYEIDFVEDDWSVFTAPFKEKYELLILNMIGDTCDLPHPGPECEAHIKEWMESGKPVLLLHGSSAAFWHWDWWRRNVGYRWVRNNDPDQVAVSTHPKRPYRLEVCKSRHPLVKKLQAIDLPHDEIYINLEQTGPTIDLLYTTTDEGSYPQAWESQTEWGGRILGFLPGHYPEVTEHPAVIKTIGIFIDALLPVKSY